MLKKILLTAALTAVSVSAFAETNCVKHPKNEQIPSAQFQARLKQQGYRIKKFKETQGGCYEIYGYNKNGQKVEIYFDTKTGKPVKSEIDD